MRFVLIGPASRSAERITHFSDAATAACGISRPAPDAHAFIIVCLAGGADARLLQLIEAHMPGTGYNPARKGGSLVTRTLPGRRSAAHLTCLMLCLSACVALLAGCERNHQPGPGPKPISGGAATSANPGASASQAPSR